MAGVSVTIGANTDELDAAVRHSKSQLRQLNDEMKQGISTAAKYGAAAVAAGGALAIGLTARGLSAVDAQAKLAKQLNTTSSSVATLSRAADLSGIRMEQVNSGVRQFTVRLAQAADGAGPAKDALKELNLSAAELSRMPLDQRLSVVAQAIQDTVPASRQAATAAKLFGEEAGLAFAQLSPEGLSQARKEAELFGTAVSDVDAAQVEAANDAFSTMALALEGVSRRLAVEVAPILTAVSKQFFAAAEEAGGFGKATSDAFAFVVDSAGFVMDAVEGIRRVFSVVADGIIAAWNTMFSKVAGHIENLMELIDNIPGIDMSGPLESIRNFGSEAGSVADMAMNNIHETLMRELPSGQFKRFVDEAREQAEVVAEEGLNMSNMLLGSDDQWEEDTEKALERQNLRNELMLERQKAAEEMMANIRQQDAEDKEEKDKQKEKAEKDFWNNSTSLMNSGSRKMFEIGKVASIAQATIKGWDAAQSAWAAGMSVGGPAAPAIAAAYTAASLAKTGMQIAAIRSATFGGGGSQSGGGGGSGSVTAGINAQSEGVNAQQPSERTIANISIQGGDVFSRSSVISLAEQMAELSDDGVSFRVTA